MNQETIAGVFKKHRADYPHVSDEEIERTAHELASTDLGPITYRMRQRMNIWMGIPVGTMPKVIA